MVCRLFSKKDDGLNRDQKTSPRLGVMLFALQHGSQIVALFFTPQARLD